MLLYPFTAEGQVLPAGQRPNILASVSEFVSPISSSAFTTSQAALSDPAKVDKLTRFMAAMYAANLYLFQNGNQHCSISAIQAVLGVSKAVAKLEYAAATDSVTGEVSTNGNFTVNQNGLLNVIDVRSQFNGFSNLASSYDFVSAIVPGVGKLIDYRIRDAAIAAYNPSLLKTKCKNLP
jgi:hypothetical protein